ncbi:MAG: hypothetical protein V4459_13480 [Pseudomonadota bacterium]
MVVVHRFRWFGWFVLCVAVILGCYLMSSRVAAERNKLTDIERSIATTQREIRALETEFDTRANLAQLQRWNGDTLKLSAPGANQYVNDSQLASLDLDTTGAGQQNAAVIPGAPGGDTPAATTAVATEPAPKAPAAARVPARIVVAAAASVSPAPRAQAAVARASAKPKPQVAMLDRRIMGGSSLSDLMRRVRADGDR